MPTKIYLDDALRRWQSKYNRSLTEDELAEKAGISLHALQRMKMGTMHSGDAFVLLKICQALECEPGELVVNHGGAFRWLPQSDTPATHLRPGSIFVSYRAMDSGIMARRIREHLDSRFGAGAASSNMRFLRDSKVLILVIGRLWSMLSDRKSKRLLDNPVDPVRLAILSAQSRNIPVLPLLVDDAGKPEMVRLAYTIDSSNLRLDMERIVQFIDKHLNPPPPPEK